ncbi:hypothetical protein [Mycobacterium sp.]|uniref:hypothetical protein n=1 Tax=Mycobacterium sp. TaxID=1785 RepID=UPI001285F651|nr:hypothetical protein [Mycobacterium sp.]KAA8969197.1 MAG: hypothetical protein F6Q13_03620 [Mycobacterium sp.]
MTIGSDRGVANQARRWGVGVGSAAGAGMAAAVIALTGAPAARADDGSVPADIGLLTTAETDINEATSVAGQTLPSSSLEFFSKLEAVQTPLLSSDNSFFSSVGDFLFSGPDQHLAHASEAFLAASEAFSSDPTSTTAVGDSASAVLQTIGAAFDEIPSTVIGKSIDEIFDVGGYDSTSASAAASDAAIGAFSVSATPNGVIDQAITDLNQGTTVLDTASTADLSTRQADVLTVQEGLVPQLESALTGLATEQDMLSASDQTLVAGVDQQLVSAAQNILSADQGFVAADQAGDLSGNSLNLTDLTVLGADLNLFGADWDASGATILAALTGGLDTTSAADIASSLDPAAAIDPTMFADLLSSIGL